MITTQRQKIKDTNKVIYYKDTVTKKVKTDSKSIDNH